MSRKNLFQTSLFVLLGVICFYVYRDHFKGQVIQISHRSISQRGARFRRLTDSETEAVVFLLNQPLKLKSVKVFPVKDLVQAGQPVWELVSDSSSAPVQDFGYGMGIRGMHTVISGAAPGTLERGVTYRVQIVAGHDKVQHDFTTVAEPAPATGR